MGGAVTAALGMAEALSRAGVEVRLAATDHGHPEPVHGGFDLRLFACRFCPWRWAPSMGRWLAREVAWADMVHVHTVWTYPTLAAARACGRRGVPYILRPAGMLEEWSMGRRPWKKGLYARLVEAETIRRANALHWTTEREQEQSVRWATGRPGLVVPLGLPRAAYEDLPPATSLGRRFPALQGRRVLLYLGRVHPKKQPEVAIRALAQVRREHPDAVLVVAGPGERRYLGALAALAEAQGVAGAVHFLGMLRGPEVQEAYSGASVFVLPSLQENFGLAAAEAMAAGCPVVVSPQVALAPLVSSHAAGRVAEANVPAVADAIGGLLADEPGRRAAGEHARSLVLQRFTWPAVAAELIRAYERVLLAARGTTPGLPRRGDGPPASSGDRGGSRDPSERP
jgi:glycosyltransferase involved in cell wall biosynthesis